MINNESYKVIHTVIKISDYLYSKTQFFFIYI